ncbi:MAG: hypothetical protein ACHQ9S_21360 [Candidatus Binatia bacterium]
MTAVRTVNSAEREQVAAAVSKLWAFGQALSVHLLFAENHAAFEEFWSQAGYEYARTGAFNEVIANRLSIELNRHLINVLATFRLFVDHWQTRLKRLSRKGGNPRFLDAFERQLDRQRQRRFDFIFFWEFRNYVQHVGLPPYRIDFSSALTAGKSRGVVYRAEVTLARDELLASYDWKNAKSLLRRQPEQIGIFEQLRRLVDSVSQLLNVAVDASLDVVGPAYQRLDALRREVADKIPTGIPAVADVTALQDSGGRVQLLWIPLYNMALVRSFMETAK